MLALLTAVALLGVPATRKLADDDEVGTFRTITTFIAKDQVKASKHGAIRGRVNNKEGERITNNLDKSGHWHSQSYQDYTVAQVFDFKKGGFFIDLASNEPVHISNSRALERDYGWEGICIDGNQAMLDKLVVQRTCKVYKAVVSSESGKLVEFTAPAASSSLKDKKGRSTKVDAEAGLGGILSKTTDNKEAQPNGTDRNWVVTQHRTVTLTDILHHAKAPSTIDYLSLDIEGAEYEAMSTFAFDQYTILLMTIERPSKDLQALLKSKGYEYLKDHGTFGDQMWAHQSIAKQARKKLELQEGAEPKAW